MSTFAERTIKRVKQGAIRTERLTSQIRTGWLLAYSDVRARERR